MAQLDSFGLRAWRGPVQRMNDPHQHTEIELNLILTGCVTYRFGARETSLAAGEWMLFWGALPHILSGLEPGSECVWVTLPLADFLRYGLPEPLSRAVLHGDPVRGREAADAALFARWAEDWQAPQPDTSRILHLELEARLRRLAHGLEPVPPAPSPPSHPDHAARLAQFITAHHLEPLQAADIARAAGLHPHYAAALFKRSFGLTMTEYLTQHRLAHAQRLLATTQRGVLEIALESGFGSSSRFYSAFQRATKRRPLEFRRDVQREG